MKVNSDIKEDYTAVNLLIAEGSDSPTNDQKRSLLTC